MMPKVEAVNPPAWPLQKTGHGIRLSKVVFALSSLFLWSLVLQAPLRYGLSLLHLNALIYLPKLLLLAAVVLLPLLRPRASPPALMVSVLAGVYLLWGMVNLPSPVQAAFGLWVLVPLLFGLWAGPLVRMEKWRSLFVGLFVVAALGVFLNPLIHYPWSGGTLDVLGKQIEISRQWGTFGLDRYSGFASVSFNAAAQLLLFGIMLVVLLERRTIKLLVWLLVGTGIALTTSKGPLVAWLVASMYFAGGALLRWPKYWIQLWLGVFTIALLSMMLLPLSTLWIHYDPTLHGYVNKLLFASFGDRLNLTWPVSMNLLNLGGTWHWWVGRGLGGIGSAQEYFEPRHFMPADNLFVYVSVWIGVPMAVFFFVALWLKFISTACRDIRGPTLPVILVIVANGVVTNQIEIPTAVFFWGLASWWVWRY